MVGQGLKPRRGGLFIANVHTPPLCFCFSAARLKQYRSAEAKTLPRSSLERILQIRAAEKQKEGGEGLLAAINRPPLRGLRNGCSAKLLSDYSLGRACGKLVGVL